MQIANSKKLPELKEFPSAIPYADGSEEQLLGIVTHNNFDEKRTWLSYQDNWALYYHLSPLRKNLINIFNWGERPRDLLELGAGCGAVTSGLAEIPNLSITALEGARARAEVIQGRCAGFDNVAIHVCDINEYPIDKKYDIVTLIGVLEYAGRYSKETDPFHALLKKVRSLLKPDGVLILAIENKLGHKYLNGAEEDHYFSPWEGINDYPNYNGSRTFEKSTLLKMLNETGFPEQQWLYPYPDYKLPSTILTNNGVQNSDFEWLDLFRISEKEPNMASNPNFDEFSLLSSLQKEKCADKFMNSFLILAGTNGETVEELVPSSLLAYRSNGKYRLPQFTVNSFFKSDDNTISITRETDKSEADSDYIQHVIEKKEPYHTNCVNLEAKLKKVFSQNNRDEKVFPLLNLWIDKLTENTVSPDAEDIENFNRFCTTVFGFPLYDSHCSENTEWIEGKYLDMIPSNILIKHPEETHVIDQEWQFTIKIPLQFVFDRGLLTLYERIPELLPYLEEKLKDETLAATKTGQLFFRKDVHSLSLFERWFQAGIFYSTFSVPMEKQSEIRLSYDLSLFLQTVTEYVEKQRFHQAILTFEKYRTNYYTTPELANFDQLIATLKSKI